MTVIVKKLGGSVAIVIPKAVAREMELSEGTTLELSSSAQAMVIRKRVRRQRPRRPIAEIVAQIKPSSYRRHTREQAEHGPVGREFW